MNIKDTFNNHKESAIALLIVYGLLSGVTTGLVHFTEQDNIKDMNARSAISLNDYYQDRAGERLSSPSALLKHNQDDLAHMKEVNLKILAGPSSWFWFVLPHDENFNLRKKFGKNPDSFLDHYNIKTSFVHGVSTPSLVLREKGDSVLTLDRADDTAMAATKAIALLQDAYKNVLAAQNYKNASGMGTYKLATDGTVSFQAETRAPKAAPVLAPSS